MQHLSKLVLRLGILALLMVRLARPAGRTVLKGGALQKHLLGSGQTARRKPSPLVCILDAVQLCLSVYSSQGIQAGDVGREGGGRLLMVVLYL